MADSENSEADALLEQAQGLLAVQPANAVALLEQALGMAPGHPAAVAALGLLAEGYQSLKRFNECAYLLESCVDLEPRHLPHHVRLCAFRLTRAHYHKAALSLQRYLDAGGNALQMERQLLEQQHPRSVVRSLRALCDALRQVGLPGLPHFKTMGDIVAFEEQLRVTAQPELSASVSSLPGLSPETTERLHAAGIGTLSQLSAASVPDLVALGFKDSEAEILVDVANAQIYLANSQVSRPQA